MAFSWLSGLPVGMCVRGVSDGWLVGWENQGGHTVALLVLLVGLSSLVAGGTSNELVGERGLVLLGLGVVPLVVGLLVVGVWAEKAKMLAKAWQ